MKNFVLFISSNHFMFFIYKITLTFLCIHFTLLFDLILHSPYSVSVACVFTLSFYQFPTMHGICQLLFTLTLIYHLLHFSIS